MKCMKRFFFFSLLVLLLGSLLVLAGCSSASSSKISVDHGTSIQLFKSTSCGCCDVYTSYLTKFSTTPLEVTLVENTAPIKEKYNVPVALRSCHTTIIGEYFIEGHMPVEAINKLLAEKPDILGIALPGMPSGAPGMPGSKTGPFVIYAVQKDGSYSEFMKM